MVKFLGSFTISPRKQAETRGVGYSSQCAKSMRPESYNPPSKLDWPAVNRKERSCMATPKGRSRRPTPKQIAALKYLIAESKNGTDLTKRILFFLIDASKGMTRNVSVGLSQDREGYTAKEIHEAGHGMSSLESCNCTTHLNELTTLMGCRRGFSMHYGAYDAEGHFSTYGQFAFQDGGYVAPM